MKFFRTRMVRGDKRAIRILAIACVAFFGATIIINTLRGNAEEIDDGIRVQEDSELRYYLQVKYDGVDRQGVESSDSATAEVRSDIINVSDKIPDGLTFLGFVESETGAFGAVERGDGITPCAGKVVDDTGDTTGWNTANTEFIYHGLRYDSASRTVNFKVKNLKAGCQLQVGIITRTPVLREGEKRRDFYNYASVLEGNLGNNSNTVHTFIGRMDVPTYKVKYEYTGDVPAGAPAVPTETFYPAGSEVGVVANVNLNGYDFSGWSTNDVSITNDSFTMPEQEVTLTGAFVAKEKYTVSYTINGAAPTSYHAPNTKSYGEGDSVTADDLAAGAVIGGYTFSGWSTNDVTVTDGDFEMPAHDVAFAGSFEKISYTVQYKFIGSVLPPNAASMLPATQEYHVGDEVTVAAKPSATGYQFSGWYSDDSFTMEAKDVVIEGEWSRVTSLFRPKITQVITNPKSAFLEGDTIKFEITVTNTASFEIKNVNVAIQTDGATLVADDGYTIRPGKIAEIASLAAGASAKIYVEYPITADEDIELEEIARLMGATADGYNEMDTSDEAMASYIVKTAFTVKQKGQGGGGDTPKTEDDVMRYVIIGAISAVVLLVLAGVYIIFKKKNKNH